MKGERVLHIELDAAAADVICWMRFLPPRTVNFTVNEILSAESKGKLARIPYEFPSTSEVEPISCRLVIRDGAALNLVAKIPKGELKSTVIKLIRKHIRKNLEAPSAPVGVRSDLFLNIFKDFMVKMAEKESEYAGVPDKYRKLCAVSDMAYRSILKEVLGCYRSVDEIQGDYNLRHLDYEGIIKDSYDAVFGVTDEKEDSDSLCKLLEFGLPDEEFNEIIKQLKERKTKCITKIQIKII